MLIMWITVGLTSLLFFILGGFMLKGKGAFLIAGYNTMSPEEKAKANLDEKAMCRFMGKIMLIVGASSLLLAVLLQLGLNKIASTSIFMVLITGVCVFAAIYGNTGNRFKKK